MKTVSTFLFLFAVSALLQQAWGQSEALTLDHPGHSATRAGFRISNDSVEKADPDRIERPDSTPQREERRVNEKGLEMSGFWIVGVLANVIFMLFFVAWAVRQWRKAE